MFDGVLRSFSVVMIGWFATSRIVKLGKGTKEESAKNVSGRVALVSLYRICRCIVILLAIFSDPLGIGEVLSAQRPGICIGCG
jgi:hypothetical protein